MDRQSGCIDGSGNDGAPRTRNWNYLMRWSPQLPAAMSLMIMSTMNRLCSWSLLRTWNQLQWRRRKNSRQWNFGNETQKVYPHLSLIARIFITPCASSVPVESLFSISGLIKNTRRSSLAPYRLNKPNTYYCAWQLPFVFPSWEVTINL